MSAVDVSGHPLPTLLKVREFATAARLSDSGVYLLIARGIVRAVRIGRSVRIPASELQRLVEGGDAE